MNLYLVSAQQENAEGELADVFNFVGSQAEAATLRAQHVAAGTPRKRITTTPVAVPTDKEGLLHFLNLVAVSPNVAVAAEKLLQK